MGRLILSILMVLIISTNAALANDNAKTSSTAYVIHLDGPISAASANYLTDHLNQAQKHARLAIIQLDTPGGLVSSMRQIVQAVSNSSVPVVTYVAPSGARAASAGAFILYASSVAAMAPGTNVGAASPIGFSGLTSPDKQQQTTSTAKQKASNDLSAYIQSLAQRHGRNADIAQKMVRKAHSITANTALQNNVIDLQASSLQDLLNQINGKQVIVNGNQQTLKTQDLTLQSIYPTWREQFLNFLASPEVAYVLLLLAFYGIIFEMMNPGLIFPGVIGVISGLLAIYGLQVLPVSAIGLLLLIAGMVLMVLEVFVTSMGLLALAGLVAFFLGSILLFDPTLPGFHIPYAIAGAFTLVSAIFFLVIVRVAIRSQSKRLVSGNGVIVNQTAQVLGKRDEHYLVRVNGETWQAQSEDILQEGDTVTITQREGLWLKVKKTDTEVDR